MTRHFWSWLVLRFSEIYVSAFLSRVDSDHLGVDSALRARKTDPLFLELNCLGVDSDHLGVDSADLGSTLVFSESTHSQSHFV